LRGTDLSNNGNFDTELFNIFEDIRKAANIIVSCNQNNENKYDCCLKIKMKNIENPFKEYQNCKYGLRIGYMLEFYELINEEKFTVNKYNEKENINNDEDENDKSKDLEINTNSNQKNEEGKKNINGKEKEEEEEE